ncbi:FAD-dependent oxidoreductase [Halalkalibacter hemicellulosilyticus]|uniref:Rieske n=1 Tax=Halalkalibacter hemicellulosilyticusJCM 9152 TaxID=1236971 RepID=W4QCQ2_9BACI|nr:FAD-dependent oxidoreductase [Halalkalibacter hemicellulosilyticus]GAE29737.1 Rieske [Halalkalibacter hemicellulosilyticusJCM 9152]
MEKSHSLEQLSPEPYWQQSCSMSSFPSLNEDLDVDVAIVGGGITGLTSAYLLAKEGMKVALLEASELANGTTGHTTAKITAQHGLIYDEFRSHFDVDTARLYYEAESDALHFIENLITNEGISCHFTKEDAILYTTMNRGVSKLEREFEAYKQIGVKSEWLDTLPLNNIPVKAALKMDQQAQFHPIEYINHLVEMCRSLGVHMYEQTVVNDVKKGQKQTVHTTTDHLVTADNVIIASHFPCIDGNGLYFSRMYADRSYVIAGFVPDDECPKGMYYSIDSPTRSLRYTTVDNRKLAIISGESHKTGQEVDTAFHYEALEQFAYELFSEFELTYKWSAQDLTTLDKIPYIGRISRGYPNVFVATGYRKWGMTNGTAAALLLTDLIMKRENRYESLFRPSRFASHPSLRQFMTQNADVAKQLLKGKLDQVNRQPEDVHVGEGAVVSVEGKRAGAYRDEQGHLHVIDTTCTHMGCELHWNDGEHSWDCPCHGSRFSYTGDVLEGPAKKPLKKLE